MLPDFPSSGLLQSKKKHTGPGWPRKLCEPVIADTDNGHDGLGTTGDGGDVAEEHPSGIRYQYTL